MPKELSLADKFGRPIVPVLYQPWDETSDSERAQRLDFQLAGLQYVDFAHQPFEAGVSDLLRALRREERAAPAPVAARARRGWLSVAGVALGVAALAAFLLARGRTPEGGIDGSWQSEVAYAWGPRATERFHFILDGETVNGTASFLGAPRGIQDGRLKDGRLTFRTRVDAGPGSPQFWNAYRGRVDGDVIHFLLQDDRGSPPLQFTAARGG